MSYEMYRYIFLGTLIASCVFFAIAVVLFFVLRIPRVISDLSGRTARKAIENIRQQNEQSGDKTYRSSAYNLARGKTTDKISKSGRLLAREATPFGTGPITEKISTQQASPSAETDVLSLSPETSVLSEQALTPAVGQTDVLAPADQPVQAVAVEYEITFIHTAEIIQ